MILSCAAMRALEERAFADGVAAEELMEEAGAAIARQVQKTFPTAGVCFAVFGKGNNGGDALVAARILGEAGWEARLVGAYPKADWKPLVKKMHSQASGWAKPAELSSLERAAGQPLVILDGLLGIGTSGGLREDLATHTRAINALRERSNAHVFALDLPTGLDGDSGVPDPACVVADTTLTIGFAKTGLLADQATNYVGRLRVLRLAELSKRAGDSDLGAVVVDAHQLRSVLPRRRFDTHKGNYGKVAIVAGSPGMLGAAAMCANACVRAGAGLVTLYATATTADRLSVLCAPEVMVRGVADFGSIPIDLHDAIAVGPGLGTQHVDEIVHLVSRAPKPMVVDADGLNSLAGSMDALKGAAADQILTPHPGEMARLAPDLRGLGRAEIARSFTHRFPNATLLLKGARTLIARGGKHLAYNSTGTPGMATGGMGDVLTGVIAALLGQGVDSFQAAQLGAWLCGRAGELAVDEEMESEESLTPTHLLNWLGPAFRALRSGDV